MIIKEAGLRVIEAQETSWGKGKTHIAGPDRHAVCETTWRTEPSHEVLNYDEVDCVKCLRKLQS